MSNTPCGDKSITLKFTINNYEDNLFSNVIFIKTLLNSVL